MSDAATWEDFKKELEKIGFKPKTILRNIRVIKLEPTGRRILTPTRTYQVSFTVEK